MSLLFFPLSNYLLACFTLKPNFKIILNWLLITQYTHRLVHLGASTIGHWILTRIRDCRVLSSKLDVFIKHTTPTHTPFRDHHSMRRCYHIIRDRSNGWLKGNFHTSHDWHTYEFTAAMIACTIPEEHQPNKKIQFLQFPLLTEELLATVTSVGESKF